VTSTFSKVMKVKKYPSIGKCIYCLNSLKPSELTDEHIVPNALLGTLIFRKAVCYECKEITSVLEREVLKDELLVPRVITELKPLNPKHKLPMVSLTAKLGQIGAPFDVKIPAEEYPKFITNVIIDEPGLLTGDLHYAITRAAVQYINLENPNKPVKFPNVATQQKIKAGAIQHMVAKIAYSYAIAEKGLNYFDSTEIRKILLEDGDEIFNYVGAAPPEDSGKSAHLHWISFLEIKGYFVCRVQLFGSIGMHPHYVVLGEKL
jgi:hypothetical protein